MTTFFSFRHTHIWFDSQSMCRYFKLNQLKIFLPWFFWNVELGGDRLYCPYKRCDFSSIQGMEPLFSHIQAYHDYRFPLYNPQIVSPCIQTPDSCIINLKGRFGLDIFSLALSLPFFFSIKLTKFFFLDASNKIVEPGQHLVVRGSGKWMICFK